MSADELRLSAGMRLRASATGHRYRVQGVDDESVVTSGSGGSVRHDRDELEDHIRRGLVEITEWR